MRNSDTVLFRTLLFERMPCFICVLNWVSKLCELILDYVQLRSGIHENFVSNIFNIQPVFYYYFFKALSGNPSRV